MTDNDFHKMVQHVISLTIQEMSTANMIDFITDRLENEFYKWSDNSVLEHFKACWPEHFKNFTFEQAA